MQHTQFPSQSEQDDQDAIKMLNAFLDYRSQNGHPPSFEQWFESYFQLSHKTILQNILRELTERGNDSELEFFATNPYISFETMEKIADTHHAKAVIYLSTNPNLPPEIMMKILESNGNNYSLNELVMIRKNLVKNPNISAEVMNKLLNDEYAKFIPELNA